MQKKVSIEEYDEVKEQVDSFIKKSDSNMNFKSSLNGDSINFDWLDEIEFACPYLDNIVRHPKLTLIQEENVVKIEKSKKVTVESIKDLSRHTNFISKIDKKTKDVQPSKILDIRSEETFNIYENRFLYTLLNDLNKFIMKKEDLLKNIKIDEDKVLEYYGKSSTDKESINIQVRITADGLSKDDNLKKLEKNIESAKFRIKRVREYLTSWQRSDLCKTLDKMHIHYINPPVKKTNIILKNPNFKIATNLWTYILNYDNEDSDKNGDAAKLNKEQNLKGLLDHSFLIDYFVLDSMRDKKKEEKEKIKNYSIYLVSEEIYRIKSLLESLRIKIDDKELFKLINNDLQNKKKESALTVGEDEIKKKFKDEIEEYLEKTQDYLE